MRIEDVDVRTRVWGNMQGRRSNEFDALSQNFPEIRFRPTGVHEDASDLDRRFGRNSFGQVVHFGAEFVFVYDRLDKSRRVDDIQKDHVVVFAPGFHPAVHVHLLSAIEPV